MPAEARTTTDKTFVPIEWLAEGKVRFLDQTLLPREEVWIETADYRVVAEAIRRLQVRGAPLIGIAAAYGLASGRREPARTSSVRSATSCARLARPPSISPGRSTVAFAPLTTAHDSARGSQRRLSREAIAIHEEDIAANHRIGDYGAKLLRERRPICPYTLQRWALWPRAATAPLSASSDRPAHGGRRFSVMCRDETRPLLQGARLTAWELARDHIPFAPDRGQRRRLLSCAAVESTPSSPAPTGSPPTAMSRTRSAPISWPSLPARTTFRSTSPHPPARSTSRWRPATTSRSSNAPRTKSRSVRWQRLTPDGGVGAENPAFDVTPHTYVTAIITENGVARAPYGESLRSVCAAEAAARG